jgi:hypothetical protein
MNHRYTLYDRFNSHYSPDLCLFSERRIGRIFKYASLNFQG